MTKSDVLVNVVLARNALPVISDLGTLGKLLRPLRVGRKCCLVDVGGDVTAYSRIDIF